MSATATEIVPEEEVSGTATGIPIRNLWHMLLYAWNEAVSQQPPAKPEA